MSKCKPKTSTKIWKLNNGIDKKNAWKNYFNSKRAEKNKKKKTIENLKLCKDMMHKSWPLIDYFKQIDKKKLVKLCNFYGSKSNNQNNKGYFATLYSPVDKIPIYSGKIIEESHGPYIFKPDCLAVKVIPNQNLGRKLPGSFQMPFVKKRRI